MPAFGRTETWTVITPAAKDRQGDATAAATPVDVPGCVSWPSSTSEQTFQADTTVESRDVLFPPNTAITAASQLARGDEAPFDVDGTPSLYASPFSQTDPGVLVTAKRQVG